MCAKSHSSIKPVLLYLLIISGLLFSACTPMTLLGSSTSVTQDFSAGYPPPDATITPLPTRNPWPPDENPNVTPSPNEKNFVGEITEISGPENKLQYTYRSERVETKEGFVFQRFYIQYNSEEIRLADDNGVSSIESTSEKHLTWTYKAFSDDSILPIKTGLYVYDLETKKNNLIISGWNVGLSEIAGNWVIYTTWEDNPPPVTSPIVPSSYTMPLFAYNIVTNKTINLTNKIPVISGRATRTFYGVNGAEAGWIEYDLDTKSYAIKLMNLESESIEALKVELKSPLFFSLSRDLVVWRDTWWHGYNLSQKEFFTIPYAPKGWEDIAGFVVTAKDGASEWSIGNTPDGVMRYFTAQVIIK